MLLKITLHFSIPGNRRLKSWNALDGDAAANVCLFHMPKDPVGENGNSEQCSPVWQIAI